MNDASQAPAIPARNLLFVSPHLDDAVFSCGRLLASSSNAVVLTVFAGSPPSASMLTDWDRSCGFDSGTQAMAGRQREDDEALGIVGATPRRLDFPDSQYCSGRSVPTLEHIAAAIFGAIREYAPAAVLLPLGLFHSDHRLAHEAALRALDPAGNPPRFAYADALYRAIPGLLDERLAYLAKRGLLLRPASFIESHRADKMKARAVACYQSQLRALLTPGKPGLEDLAKPEQYWFVEYSHGRENGQQ
jgi:LmbE family N-acetylglucosaminyl deacetylase